MTKTLVALGFHDRESPHFTSMRDTFVSEGWTVMEMHTHAKSALGKVQDLMRQWRAGHRRADAVLVTFPSHHLMPLAWLLTRLPRKPLFFDSIISLHDTLVTDRRKFSRFSLRALFLWLLDWLGCHLADTVIVDTRAHGDFFRDTFGVKEDHIRVIYLGSRPELFPARTPRLPGSPLHVLFYGTYIPLQGIEYILDAAAIVEKTDPSIRFTLVGGGQTKREMEARALSLGLQNLTFLPFLPLADVMQRVAQADVTLGIFGLTPKTARVIPHKVVDSVTAGVPVITCDSPAIRERYENHPLVTLCPAGDATALAEAILLRARAAKEEKR